jgi:hypothetical protein
MAAVETAEMLRKLQNSFQKIKALLAWRQLNLAERQPGLPPSFVFDNRVEEDLRNEYSRFAATLADFRSILNNTRTFIPTDRRRYLRHRLLELESQVRGLEVSGSLNFAGYGRALF